MSDTRQQALPAGTRIGIYEIQRVRGAGPFGITYRAWNEHLNTHMLLREYFPRDFAVRLEDGCTIAPKSKSERAIFHSGMSRFLEEAENLSGIEHPNLVCVLNKLQENGTAYSVMEPEDGVSLAKLCEPSKSRLGEDELRIIFVPILEALEQVHGKGFVHGAINPANVLVRRNGEPVLLDFAASRLTFSERRNLLGTILSEGYAPAEQYDPGHQASPQTDLYALGATMYQCVTGLVPVAGRERLLAIQDEKPDSQRPAVEAAPPGYSETLLRTIDWLISPRVADRPQSAADVLAALRASADEEAEGQASEQRAESIWAGQLGPGRERRLIQIAGTGLLVAVLAVAGVWYLWKSEEQPQVAALPEQELPSSAPAPADVPLTAEAETESRPARMLESDQEPSPEALPSVAAVDEPSHAAVSEISSEAAIEGEVAAEPTGRDPLETMQLAEHRAPEQASDSSDSASAPVAADPRSQGSPDAAPVSGSESQAIIPEVPAAPGMDVVQQTSTPEIKAQPSPAVQEPSLEGVGTHQLDATAPKEEIALVPPAALESGSDAETPVAPRVLEGVGPRPSEEVAPKEDLVPVPPAALESGFDAETTTAPQVSALEATERASQAATPQPPATEAVRNEIEGLMSAAEKDIAALRLTTPRGANALEHYQAVLALEPGHPGAHEGLERIVERYVWLIDKAINRGRLKLARLYLERAEKISPEAPGLKNMRAQLGASEPVRATQE